MDIVYITGIRCKGIIGVWPWERKVRQSLVIDLELASDVSVAAKHDALKDALDYVAVTERVQKYVRESSFQLIETLAENLATVLLSDFSLTHLKLRLDKGAAVSDVAHVGVVIERDAQHL